LYLYFVFALADRNNEIQKERIATFGHRVGSVNEKNASSSPSVAQKN
jgi:hypothetical protein